MDIIRYFFTGRIGRLNYILGQLFLYVIYIIIILFISTIYQIFGPAQVYGTIFEIFILILFLLLNLSLTIKRLHDVNYSSLMCFVFVIPIINLIFYFILLIYPGDKGTNDYGSPPK